ncbi:4-beta-D-xylan xylohydrolase) (Xylan 1 [Durusdinium trenchii]|uniref:4-beta-D-xylan xylohydrolase) (Xylan 1 n=1 Tax=Durusdinium trenchii TaxID=1381693 RepID=A0ABP0NWU2_9DINO
MFDGCLGAPYGGSPKEASVFVNPIIPGGFPDPSICRVGETWYICNSSFEYFPGLPIHESKDLVNWSWVGHGLHRKEQVSGAVNLVDVKSDDGIQAPSIRYHDGTFYIITTCVYRPPDSDEGKCTNFIVTASDPRGPWSDPHVIEDAPGIDPDIFFDDDGKVWYVGTAAPAKPNFPGEGEIYCHELDLKNWKFTGERHYLWRGAVHGGVFVEGPHMYKHEGSYYLMAAEGGTGVNHSVVIAISEKVTGPFYPNDRNPILTSRHLSYDNWVHSTGHGDLFHLPDGRSYMVCLGIRAEEGEPGMKRSNMGRETYLLPVTWEREPMEWHSLGPSGKRLWPVCSPETGKVERTLPLPLGLLVFAGSEDSFEKAALDPEWLFRRVPKDGMYNLNGPGLRLKASPEVLAERTSCSFMGVRQRQTEFEFSAKMSFEGSTGVAAGVAIVQKDDNYLTFMVESGKLLVALKEKEKDERNIATIDLPSYSGSIVFKIRSADHKYNCAYSLDDGSTYTSCAEMAASHLLSLGYTGSCLGPYCTSRGQVTESFATFAWVRLSSEMQ